MGSSWLFLLVLLVSFGLCSGVCPRQCACSAPAEVHCTFRALLAVPAGISKQVQRINFGFNTISQITDASFSGLRKLELLMMHGNNVQKIPDGAFQDLVSLQVLKMSYNKLTVITDRTFSGLTGIIRLHLDHNHISSIHPQAFLGLTSLRLLHLEANRLQQLHPHTFSTFSVLRRFPVSTLKHLHISDNLLQTLSRSVLENTPQLETLLLTGNPWSCDCRMRWLQDWSARHPGVMKCKKDRTFTSGQLCPLCASPKHLKAADMLDLKQLVCSGPSIISPGRNISEEDTSELLPIDRIKPAFGNVSFTLSDEHGTKVDLICQILQPQDSTTISWNHTKSLQIAANVTLVLDVECPVSRDDYESFWRLLAYYSEAPVHLRREIMLRREPALSYRYRQDAEKDGFFYTSLKANVLAHPSWLMQSLISIKLNRPYSTSKSVRLILSTQLTANADEENVRSWVMIENDNKTQTSFASVVGGVAEMHCRVQSSGNAVIYWMLPNGSKVKSAFSSVDGRVSISSSGKLNIKTIEHRDSGVYYCIAEVDGDVDVLPFRLSVIESSNPLPNQEVGNSLSRFIGQSAFLTCLTKASPDAEINWVLPDGNVLNAKANTSRALLFPNGTLYIPVCQLNDNGYYKCVAMNNHGVDVFSTKLTVIRRKLIQPLRQYPIIRPQSAAGVSTKVKAFLEDMEEASGDISETRLTPTRRRRPNARRFGNIRHRRPFRNRAGLPNQRPVNTKNKIDPQKWADLLSKIRAKTSESNKSLQSGLIDNTESSSGDSGPQEKTFNTDVYHTPQIKERDDDNIYRTTPSQLHTTRSNQVLYISHPTSAPHYVTTHVQDRHASTVNAENNQIYSESVISPELETENELNLPGVKSQIGGFDSGGIDRNVFATASSVRLSSAPNSTQSRGRDRWRFGGRRRIKFRRPISNLPTSRVWSTSTTARVTLKTDDQDASIYPTTPSKVPSVSQTIPVTLHVYSTTLSRGIPINPTQSSHIYPTKHNELTNEVEENINHKVKESNFQQTQQVMPNSRFHPTISTNASAVLRLANEDFNSLEKEEQDGSFASAEEMDEYIVPTRKHPTSRLGAKTVPLTTPRLEFTSRLSADIPKMDPTEISVTVHTDRLDDFHLPESHFRDVLRENKSVDFTSAREGVTSTEESVVSSILQSQTYPLSNPNQSFKEEESIPLLTTSTQKQSVVSVGTQIKSLDANLPNVLYESVTSTEESVVSSIPQTQNYPLAKQNQSFKESVPSFTTTSTPKQSRISVGTQIKTLDRDIPMKVLNKSITSSILSQNPPLLKPNQSFTEEESIPLLSSTPKPSIKSVGTQIKTLDTSLPVKVLNKSIILQQSQNYLLSTPNQRLEEESISVLTSNQSIIAVETQTESLHASSPMPTFTTHKETNEIAFLQPDLDSKVGQRNRLIPELELTTSVNTPPATTSMIPNTTEFMRTTPPLTTSTLYSTTTSTTTPVVKLAPRYPLPDNRIPIYSKNPGTNYIGGRIPSTNHRYPYYHSRNIKPNIDRTPSLTTSPVDLSIIRSTITPKTLTRLRISSFTTASTTQPNNQIQIQDSMNRQLNFPVLQMRARITDDKLHTVSVNAGTDVQLPCNSVGEPRPLLTWTKVSTGAVMSTNTKVQRFEVHPNGTFTIRNVHLQDRGQYLCSASNAHGTDKMMVTLVVLAHVPRMTSPRHQDVTVYIGNTALLQCQAQGLPIPNISWMLPDRSMLRSVSNTQQKIMLLANGTLQIKQTNYLDTGVYKCIASNAAGADMLSVRLQITALAPVIQEQRWENYTLSDGHAALIHCTANGAPNPTVRWVTSSGMQLRPSQFVNSNLFVFPNGTLFIRNPTVKDSGIYECVAVSSVGMAKRSVNLQVKRNSGSARILSTSAHSTDVHYGDQLSLNCSASGSPTPRIIWRTPAKKLVDSYYSFDRRMKVLSNGTLTITSVTEQDEGEYLCAARNNAGDDYVLLKVTVMMKAAKIDHKSLSEHKVLYGGELKVDCIASGLPNPEVSWSLPDGTMINSVLSSDKNTIRAKRYVMFDNGTLYLNEVGMKEEGDYTCYAKNQMGKDEMKVHIKVLADAPVIRNNAYSVIKVTYGETAILNCSAKGEPTPVITWISPDKKVIVPMTNKYQISNDGTLHIHKTQKINSGNYTCMARSVVGIDRKVVLVEVLVFPPVINGFEHPGIIRKTAVRDQRVLFDCKANGNPFPRIIWLFPNNVVLPAPYYGSRITVHRNGTLDIHAVRMSDSVELICIARNEFGETKLHVKLEVTEDIIKPQLRNSPTDSIQLTIGKPTTLNCSIEGNPAPQITWTLPNGTSLYQGTTFSRFHHRSDGALLIKEPSSSDAGLYRCVGRNSGGFVERNVTLVSNRKPEITNQYSSLLSIINGEDLHLDCVSDAHPPPKLTWTLPSGVVLSRAQSSGRHSVLNNGTLSIHRTSVYDRGTYRCQISNDHGSSSLSVSVIVIAYPPRITSGPAAVTYGRVGVALTLDCRSLASPRAEVVWQMPDGLQLKVDVQPRLYGNKHLHPQGVLQIHSPSSRDSGVYKCTAKNVLGSDSRSTYVYVF
ncbi:matrix-remodeling-associated protein 5 [Danio rerio]|uniref:Matrix-remodeling-associated protein 5 n=1 Tax=Danio rerio TaxID=7955 RepID=F1QHX4_DANRE|nr:matrix-remodeling-associated protein 5 [Danio rerio]|eukprot:XP_017213354.1 matrix-remodeling-associated protein 5 [Danio rerio]